MDLKLVFPLGVSKRKLVIDIKTHTTFRGGVGCDIKEDEKECKRSLMEPHRAEVETR